MLGERKTRGSVSKGTRTESSKGESERREETENSLLQGDHDELNGSRAVFPQVSSNPGDVRIVESSIHLVENEERSGLEAGRNERKKEERVRSDPVRDASRKDRTRTNLWMANSRAKAATVCSPPDS